MSISKLSVVMFAMLTAACTTTGHYDPATGQPVAVVESGTCLPGQKQDGKSCVCSRERGNYVNCSMQVVAKSPPRPQYETTQCLLQTVVTYQDCLRYGLGSAAAPYQVPGSPYYSRPPARGFRYQCNRDGSGCGNFPH